MKLKSKSQILSYTASIISLITLTVYLCRLSNCFTDKPSFYQTIQPLSMLMTFLFSAIYFVGKAAFNNISKKHINTLMLLQGLAAIISIITVFLDIDMFDIEDILLYILYVAFFLYLYIREKCNLTEIPLFVIGCIFVVYSVILYVSREHIIFRKTEICVYMCEYMAHFLYCDSLSELSFTNKSDGADKEISTETIGKFINNKKTLLTLIPIATFVVTTVYLLLINYDILYDLISNRIFELLNYGSLCVLFAMLSRILVRLFKNNKVVKAVLPYPMALISTFSVICLNTFYHFISYHDMHGFNSEVFPILLKQDVLYFGSFIAFIRYPAILIISFFMLYAFCQFGNSKQVSDSDKEMKESNIIQFPQK